MRSGLHGYAAVAALFGAAAVAMGAFGAHALREQFDASSMQVWHTAVEYQFWHVLALFAVVVLARGSVLPVWRIAALSFIAGIILFCGSLYALALGAPAVTGMITPLGGLCFIVGWVALAVAMLQIGPR